MGDPVLRARDASGEVYDDPSEDALFMFCEDLEAPGSSFIVERIDDGQVAQFMRITRRADGYSLEGTDAAGLPPISSMRATHEALTRWAFNLPDWRAPLSTESRDESGSEPSTESLSIGWIEGGWLPDGKRWREGLQQIAGRVAALRTGVHSPVNLGVIFHVPGNNWTPDYTGVRTGTYSKPERTLAVDVALPPDAPEDVEAFLKDRLIEAVDATANWARHRNQADSLEALYALVASI